MRGEYAAPTSSKASRAELPPRARRIPREGQTDLFEGGTTSACAENTMFSRSSLLARGNYLRVRGEYLVAQQWVVAAMELPPRARRIHTSETIAHKANGTTSACAENTPDTRPGCVGDGNYLRVRGEYRSRLSRPCTRRELPPRARRILQRIEKRAKLLGTTSACAENTCPH